MKTCTCPMQATRNGFVKTGTNASCPFHGVTFNERKPVIPARPAELAREGTPRETGEIMLHCEECGLIHAPDARCDAVDEN